MAGECVIRCAVECGEDDVAEIREAISNSLRYIPHVRRVAVAVAVAGTIRDSVVDQGAACAKGGLKS